MEENRAATKWLYFLVGIVFIGLFIFLIAPALQKQSDTFDRMSSFIDQHDVDTGVYVHTDSELADDAAVGVRNTIEHPPKGPEKK